MKEKAARVLRMKASCGQHRENSLKCCGCSPPPPPRKGPAAVQLHVPSGFWKSLAGSDGMKYGKNGKTVVFIAVGKNQIFVCTFIKSMCQSLYNSPL